MKGISRRSSSLRLKLPAVSMALVGACLFAAGCGTSAPVVTDYAESGNWAYLETDVAGRDADVFFVCPSVYAGEEGANNMPLDDEETKESFVGAINMEKGIYDQDGTEEDNRFFAPYYRQIGLNVYELPEEEREPYLEIAYRDVEAAFEYYLEHYNDGRPIILAGFSQGADMCIRLMKDRFDEEGLQDQLVACYAIGWRVTADEVDEYPQLEMAQGEDDTGVIVSFNSESPETDGSLLIPEGTKTFAINPLNWKTDGTPADRSLNEGACFTDYSGEIKSEIDQLTGAYIDEERGALKVPDVSEDDYPAGLSIFEDGVYHLYDYQFFYRNLQENVEDRLDAYLEEQAEAD
ncbi:hypothetical protein B5F74_03205 [Collinsella sp. An271]|uniref:DUF3089 domain-containing protein n=1 Tax=Collinsella sp. An271 TaxID=1965616 RepID=UPI000B55A25E|nr:DUF3089 domain-containing protein [Collinsella sp. An271]OUO61649.1 hypothetical protein B5F74_03205 [Collinsella sp. An271]